MAGCSPEVPSSQAQDTQPKVALARVGKQHVVGRVDREQHPLGLILLLPLEGRLEETRGVEIDHQRGQTGEPRSFFEGHTKRPVGRRPAGQRAQVGRPRKTAGAVLRAGQREHLVPGAPKRDDMGESPDRPPRSGTDQGGQSAVMDDEDAHAGSVAGSGARGRRYALLVPRPLPAIARDLRMWASRTLGEGLAPPDWLTVNLTLRCNLHCVMCTTCYDSPEMSTREVLDLIDQAADWGVGVFNPLGGEPFIRADLEQILAHAARRDMHTTLTTNGTLIKPERAARVATVPVEKLHINISLDGPESAHDSVRGVGTFQRTMAGYAALREADARAGNPERKVCANVILHRRNVAGFVDFVRDLGARGFHGVQLLNLFRDRDDDTVGGLWFDEGSWPELERVVTELTTEPLVLNAPRDLLLVPRYYRDGLSPLEAPCWAGWKELYVNADGSVIMCDGKLDFLAGRFGSVREQTLRQLWASPALRARRSVVKQCTTPCVQNCYLRRDSDHLAPLVVDLARHAGRRLGLPRRLRTIEAPLTLELCDIPDHPEDTALQRFFARSPIPFAQVAESPDRLAELRDLHYLDFGRGFFGADVVDRVLDAVADAGLRFSTLALRWRGEPLWHPDLQRIVAALRARTDRVVVHTSGLLLTGRLEGAEVWAEPRLAGPNEALAASRAARFADHAGAPPLPAGPAVSWEARVTDGRDDVRLARRLGDALKEPFAEIWARHLSR